MPSLFSIVLSRAFGLAAFSFTAFSFTAFSYTALALTACTTPTANYCETSADCVNSAAAFCDVDGEFGGSMTCIPSPPDATPTTVTVTLNLKGEGAGVVTSSDGVLDCSLVSCSVEVEIGTAFLLTAEASGGDTLVSWSGGCSGFEECSFVASEDLTVAVAFEPIGAPLWTATSLLIAPVGNARVFPNAIAIDSQDNVVVAGHLVGTPDFGGGPLLSGDASKTSAEVFAVQWDSEGAHRWSHAYSGTGFSDDFAHGVAITSSDDVLIVGKFEESLTFASPGEALDGSTFDMFMARLGPDGTHTMSQGIGGNGNSTIVLDGNDEMMVTSNALRFEWFSAAATRLRNLLPTPPSGTVISSTLDGFGRALVVGTLTDLVDFAPGVGGGEIGASATTRVYVAKLNWDSSFHSRSGRVQDVEAIHCVVADPAGDGSYYIVGSVNQQLDLQGGGGGIIVPTGTRNGFVAKFSNSHSYLWSVHIPSTLESAATACALDPRGNLLVGGSFNGDFQLSPGSPTLGGGIGTFVAKYEAATGNLVWGRLGGGNGTVRAMASDSVGRTTAVIEYSNSAFTIGEKTFPEGTGVANLVVVQYAP